MDPTPDPATPAKATQIPNWRARALWAIGLLVALAAIRVAAGSSAPTAPSNTVPPPAAVPTGVSAPAGAVPQAQGVMFDWNQDTRPGETTYAVGGLLLTLSSHPGDQPQPVLRVAGPGSETFSVDGEAGLSTAHAGLGVGRIDPASPTPQVIFTSYSGGAHCCTSVTLLERLGGVWRATAVASVDGDGVTDFPKDLAGDGEIEFQFYDQSFLYAFASYAQSFAPPTLLTVRNGLVADVSAQPRFQKIFEAYIDAPRQDCITNHNNGACAAFVAAAARLGKADEAWPIMLQAYDRGSTWILPTACRALATPCPAGQAVTFASYPEALLWFLGAQGYVPKPYLAAADATGPSFACDGLTSPVLRLICGVPELAQADRRRAELFGRVLALSPDPVAARASERQFIRDRNAAPADAFTLLRLYEARVATLQAALPD